MSWRIKTEPKMYGIGLLNLVFLLPNLHFWSGSFGKGSIIFMAIGLYFFGLNRPANRWIQILIGGLIIYHVRPHVMFVILISTFLGFIFSAKDVRWTTRVAVLVVSGVAFFYIYNDVLLLVGIEQGDELIEGLDLTSRIDDLSKATSGVDISNYSFPMLMFTFLYRPLFFDAPGLLGIIVSFENILLLLITIQFLFSGGLKYLFKGDYMVKSAFFSFITVSIALAQISANLGLAIRQKSQVMLLFLFVIVEFFDSRNQARIRSIRFKNQRLKNQLINR
ncbi:hypothetical protein JMN32_00510 [Fulvivirga sp. 29W222]|uniref:Uncharacterized protein n=1 Tax=Fulvivirga marina TaxID=2494733 RepID=A0A937KCA9_9BACT|nr:hypothetical protein [Fulvivirga marina]MBL6444770.1 hypothetical protein [Fulvivirga marina]